MATTIYHQLVTDTQEYIKTQYKLLQIKGIEQTSRLIALIITIVVITAIVVIGVIFLAIALAAWLKNVHPWSQSELLTNFSSLSRFHSYCSGSSRFHETL